jgi:hypothetical protein
MIDSATAVDRSVDVDVVTVVEEDEPPHRRSLIRHLPITAIVAGYVWYFTRLTLDIHHGLGSSAFDLGLYDQGVGLMSRFKTPFVTLMGRNLIGDHTSFILVLLVQLYWIANSPIANEIRAFSQRIPPNAVVSATHSFAPHIDHRERIYMFPTPFAASTWGVCTTKRARNSPSLTRSSTSSSSSASKVTRRTGTK